MLNKILKIVDVDTSFIPLTYYNLYLNFTEKNLANQAEKMKDKLLIEFPNSVFSMIILNPNYLASLDDLNSAENDEYDKVYTNSAFKNHKEILNKTVSLSDGDLKEKYLFLRAMSTLSLGDTSTTLNLLAEIKRGNDKDLSNYASSLLQTLQDPSKLIESNREAVEETPYKFDDEVEHFVMFIMPRKGVDISFLKALISDYNSSSYSTEVFEINAMLMGMDYHILTVKFFENALPALNYCSDVVYSKDVIKELKKNEYFIMAITRENFQEFYINKDINGYKQFFENKYLAEN